jgi:hypothetical protein
VARVPAAKIEAVVLDALRRHIGDDALTDNTEITTYVRQIEVRPTEIAISLMKEEKASEDEQGQLTRPHRAAEQDAPSTPPRRHCSRRRLANTGPSDPLRHPDEARHRDCARTAVAIRDRGRR